MDIFKEVKLQWNGKEYVIPPNAVMMCIAKVEDVVTLAELVRYSNRNTMPLAKLAQAFGVVLRYAGANVSDDEIYLGMFADGDMKEKANNAITTLLVMMMPPAHLAKFGGTAGKAEATPDARSSKKPTKQR